MRRSLLAAALVTAAPLIALPFLRLQSTATARVTRRGRSVDVAQGRIAVVSPFGASSCIVPQRGESLFFQRTLHEGDVDVNVNFSYTPPASLPEDWPEGDWCTSLSRFVERHTGGENSLQDPHA